MEITMNNKSIGISLVIALAFLATAPIVISGDGDRDKMPPLHQAVDETRSWKEFCCNIPKIAWLLAKGHDVNEYYQGHTPLHRAGSFTSGVMLVAAGADINAATRPNGFTPLHLYSDCDNTPPSKLRRITGHLLLAAGADPDARTSSGYTPLHWAAARGNHDAIHTLLRAGAASDIRSIGDTYRGPETPLQFVTTLYHGQRESATVRTLLEAGVPLEEEALSDQHQLFR